MEVQQSAGNTVAGGHQAAGGSPALTIQMARATQAWAGAHEGDL